MKKTIQFLVIAMAFIACSKSDHEGGNAQLVGTWNLEMIRADPGSGNATFHSVSELEAEVPSRPDLNRVIEFKADGSFSDPARPQFDRYSRQKDTITLTSTVSSEIYHFYIMELNRSTLAFYFEGLWCGKPLCRKI